MRVLSGISHTHISIYLCLSCLNSRKNHTWHSLLQLAFSLNHVHWPSFHICVYSVPVYSVSLHKWIEISFTSLGHLQTYSASTKYSADSPKKLLLSLQIPPFFPVLLFLLSSSPADWTQMTGPSFLQSQCLVLFTPECSSWGNTDPVYTHSFHHSFLQVRGLPSWLYLHEVNSCISQISVNQVLI